MRWIPVTESLPPIETEVLISDTAGWVTLAYLNGRREWERTDDSVTAHYAPLAWAHVPAPYVARDDDATDLEGIK
jgi:hypothetical protein